MKRSHPARDGFTLIELLVVIAIIAILIGLLLPAVQKVREAATRVQCINNLKEQGLALHKYHDNNGGFPSGMTTGGQQNYWSWMAHILPYVEQENVYDQARAFAATNSYPWAPNPGLGVPMKVFTCPADPRGTLVTNYGSIGQIGLTMYLGNCGTTGGSSDGVLYKNSKVRMADITDGTSNTIFVGERPPSSDLVFGWWFAGYGWDGTGSADVVMGSRDLGGASYFGGAATNVGLRPGNVNNKSDAAHWWSSHPNGGLFLMGDGSARFIPYTADAILPALQTRAGGEVVDLP